jgi:hypothetical protein
MSPPLSTSLPSRNTLRLGLLGGLIHLGFAGGLWVWFGFTTRVQGNELFLGYILIGAVALGVVPTLLLVTKRLVSPILTIAGFGLGSAYRTWSVYVAPEIALTPVDPTPFGWYLLGWIVVIAVALILGGGEYWIRHLGSGRRDAGSLSSSR